MAGDNKVIFYSLTLNHLFNPSKSGGIPLAYLQYVMHCNAF